MAENSRRDQFINTLKTKLDELNEQIGKLEDRATEASGKVKERYKDQLEDVRAKRDQLEVKLKEVRAASESELERLKGEADHAWKALKNSYNYFLSHFK